jgi:hypothetical protein
VVTVDTLLREVFCPRVILTGRSRGVLIGLSVRTAFLRVAATAGISAHTTSGEGVTEYRFVWVVYGYSRDEVKLVNTCLSTDLGCFVAR